MSQSTQLHLVLFCAFLMLGLACGDSKAKENTSEPLKEARVPEVATKPVVEQAPEVEAKLSALAGVVEVKRGDDPWKPAELGDNLGLEDHLRTQGDSTANLRLGQVSVLLEEDSEVTVQEMSAEVKNLRLDKGLLAAKVQGGGKEKLIVTAAGSSALAEASDGAFTVFNYGEGLVAVAPSAGTVKLTSNGGDEQLAVGQRGVVTNDGKPAVDTVPRSVLLNVNWPTDELPRPRDVVVNGKVDPGTRVKVNGESATVNHDGSFSLPVSVTHGKNKVKVVAHDLTGTSTTTKSVIDVAPRAPKANADTKNLWDK